MTRFTAAILLASSLGLAMCGPKTEEAKVAEPPETAVQTPSESFPSPTSFPAMTASYKASYLMTEPADPATAAEPGPSATVTSTIEFEVAAWKQLRYTMPHFDTAKAAAGYKTVGIFDDVAGRMILLLEGPNAPKTAVMQAETGDSGFLDFFREWQSADGAAPKKVGSDTILGLTCDVWEAAADEGEVADQACITSDGVFLRAGKAGAPQPDVIATKVERGKIDPARFMVPEGYEVIDLGPCNEKMKAAMADAQSGKTPDMSIMQECNGLFERAGAVFSAAE